MTVLHRDVPEWARDDTPSYLVAQVGSLTLDARIEVAGPGGGELRINVVESVILLPHVAAEPSPDSRDHCAMTHSAVSTGRCDAESSPPTVA